MAKRFGKSHESYAMLAKAINKGEDVLVPAIDDVKALQIQHKLLLDYDCSAVFVPSYRITDVQYAYDEYGRVIKIKGGDRVLGGFVFKSSQ